MATIDEMRAWCNTARKLLKVTTLKVKSTESKALKRHVNAVFDLLKQVEGDRKLAREVQGYLKEAQTLQAELTQVADDKQGSKDKDRDKAQHELAGKFTQLEQRIRQTMAERERGKQAAWDLMVARQVYQAEYNTVMQAVELLKVIPKSSPSVAQNLLDKVQLQVQQDTVDGYTIGKRALKAVNDEVERQKKVAENLHKAELKQWQSKPLAQQKLVDARKLYAEIEPMVGIEAIQKQYLDTILEAEKLGTQNNWTAVLSTLEKLKGFDKPKDCQKKSQQQLRSLDQISSYKDGLDMLSRLRTLVPADEVAAYETEFRSAANAVLASPKALKPLEDLAGKLATAFDAASDAAKELRLLSGDLKVLLGLLKAESASLQVLPFQTQFDNVEALIRDQQQALAKTAAIQLKSAMQAALPGRKKEHEDWLAGKAESVKLGQELERLRASKCTAVTSRVASAMQYASPVIVQQHELDHDWACLVSDLGKAREAVAELRKINDDFERLENFRSDASRAVRERHEQIKPALDKLASAVADALRKAGTALFDSTQKYQADIVQVNREWSLALGSVSDQGVLEAARDRAIDALDHIEEEMLAAADPQGIARLIEAHERELARPLFEQRWDQFGKLLERLQSLDNAAASELAAAGQKMRNTAVLNYKQGVEDIALLLGDGNRLVQHATQAALDERNKAVDLGKQVLAEITRVKDASKSASSFKEAFVALGVEHTELMLLAQSSNHDAVKEAVAGLAALKLRVARFAPEQQGAGVSMDKVMTALDDSARLFGRLEKLLEANNPRALSTLTQRLGLLKTAVMASEPDDGMLKIAAFTQAVTGAESGAKTVAALRTEYGELEPTVLQAFKVFDDRKVAPAYAKELKTRLDAAHDLAKQPTKLYEAVSKLKALDSEISAASLNLQVAMGKEKGIREGQHKTEATEKEYERALKLLESQLIGEARKAVAAKDGDSALIPELERMVGVARQSAKKGDHAKALQQVELTMERARQIVADPYGPAIGSRKNLPKDSQVYREALAAFRDGLDLIHQTALKVVPTMAPAVSTKLQDMLNRVKSKFDPNAFEGVIRQVTAKDIDANQRRAAREVALAKVRAVQATLTQNPQVVSLLGNPLAKSEFSVVYRRLQSALTRLDANIQRCCR